MSPRERTCLVELLDQSISDLRSEIAHTDSPFFKDQLRERKGVLNDVAEKLKKAADENGRKQE